MTVCGLWPSPRRLIAVIVDDQGKLAPPITALKTEQACSALLAWLNNGDLDAAVLSDRDALLINLAQAVKLPVQLIPHDLLQAIRVVTGYTHRPHAHTAALLARWYLSPRLRRFLRTAVVMTKQPDQLKLL